MTPDQFLGRLKRGAPPACLLLGAEMFGRDRCRAALLDAVLAPDERENGLAQHDLTQVSLRDVIDDARSLSLFAANRLIVVSNAEAALPGKKAGEEDEESNAVSGDAQPLADYLRDPSPGVTLVFEAVRFEFEGDDKKKLERVGKFYAAIPEVVELKRYSLDEARREALALAKQASLAIDRSALDLLVESLGGDVARIAVEIEKLRLYAGAGGRSLTADDVSTLSPEARATTIFALVGALGRRDRARSLQILDTLIQEGEYLPLALSFLATQFRLALIAKEAGLRSSGQIQGYFAKVGVPMWSSRAEQVSQTLAKFSKEQLDKGLRLIFGADRDLRSARPDDRIVMERFVLELTA